MTTRVLPDACLERLLSRACPLLQAAQRQLPRDGPGRPHEFQDWQIASLILAAVLHRRKSKSAQYAFLLQRQADLRLDLGLNHFPARSTYFTRYRQAHRLFRQAISLEGLKAIADGLVDADVVAVDKSLIAARGRPCHPRRPQPKGADCQAAWCYSQHDGWVWGYSFEVVVTATKHSLVFPLLASAGRANQNECRSLPEKAAHLPAQTRYVLADRGYDANACQEAVELNSEGQPRGRRFLCPLIRRAGKPAVGAYPHRGRRGRQVAQRQSRQDFIHSPRGRRLYARRGQTVEPFHDWFKTAFELTDRVWHRGLQNNQTQLLAALFAYQLLVRYNDHCGYHNAKVKWILDAL